jgi:lipopolysaccharide/colanic/teichoic acid biosynthesis glycosyltransferase
MTSPKLKRFFDFVVSLTGLLLLTPLFVVVGTAIKINDKGPVFFRHRRVGRGGNPFYLFKFRSMRVLDTAREGLFEPGNRSRVTWLGRLLRKYKIDELPQLINVLKGEMSLVGPRPEVEKWITVYPERWERVLSVKPGITDRASIEFRQEESILAGSEDPEQLYKDRILPRKLDLCEEYVQNNSFSGDIRLIFATISGFFFNR